MLGRAGRVAHGIDLGSHVVNPVEGGRHDDQACVLGGEEGKVRVGQTSHRPLARELRLSQGHEKVAVGDLLGDDAYDRRPNPATMKTATARLASRCRELDLHADRGLRVGRRDMEVIQIPT